MPKSRLIVDASMVHDPSKAGARSRRGLVDTLPQRLKVIGVIRMMMVLMMMIIMLTRDNSQSENLQSYSESDAGHADQKSEEPNPHHYDCC